jgi:hypothetical protein
LFDWLAEPFMEASTHTEGNSFRSTNLPHRMLSRESPAGRVQGSERNIAMLVGELLEDLTLFIRPVTLLRKAAERRQAEELRKVHSASMQLKKGGLRVVPIVPVRHFDSKQKIDSINFCAGQALVLGSVLSELWKLQFLLEQSAASTATAELVDEYQLFRSNLLQLIELAGRFAPDLEGQFDIASSRQFSAGETAADIPDAPQKVVVELGKFRGHAATSLKQFLMLSELVPKDKMALQC